MIPLPKKYGDFTELERLDEVLTSKNLIVAEGEYPVGSSAPGPHIMVSSPDSDVTFDFVKKGIGQYVLYIRKK